MASTCNTPSSSAGMAPRAPGVSALMVLILGVIPLWNCHCEQDFGIKVEPGSVDAVLCNPVTGQREAGHTLQVTTKDGSRETVSDTAGHARLDNLTPGPVTVRLQHLVGGQLDARLDHVEELKMGNSQTLTVLDPACIDFALPPGRGGIQGQVCNRHTGALVVNANVTAQSTRGETQTTTTDTAGFFVLPSVAAGDHVVTVRGEGYQRAFPAHVEAGQVTQLALAQNCNPLSPDGTGAVGGQLCATNGAGPWSLAVVTVVLANGVVLEDTTDVNGAFLLEGVPAGDHDVMVAGGGNSTVLHVTVRSGETTTASSAGDCPLPDPNLTGEVRGQLCDPDAGGWLRGALAQATQGSQVLSDLTDDHGRFHLAGLLTGDAVVTVTKGAYARTFTVPIVAGTTVTVADGVCAPPTWQCKDQTLTLQDAAPLRIMLVVDKSGSMSEPGLDGNKWSSAKAAVKTVTQQLDGEAVFGMALFPAGPPASAGCTAGAVAVSPQLGNAGAIASALDGTFPGGGTPTNASVLAVHQWLLQNPVNAATLVILATDGVPNCNSFSDGSTCACPAVICLTSPRPSCCQGLDPRQCCVTDPSACLDDNGTTAAISTMAASGIATYVIGLPGSEDPTDVLTRMAQAGGTNAGNGRAYYQPTSTAELTRDMTGIVQSNRSCRFELDGIPNDPQQMEVRMNGNTIVRDQGRRAGWDLAGDHGVQLYGAACNSLRTGVNNVLTVHFCTDA